MLGRRLLQPTGRFALSQRLLAALRALALPLLAAALLGACASAPQLDAAQQEQLAALLPADVVLLGEQHDAAEHHALERAVVHSLAARGQLAALVLEMAERGRSTRQLSTRASAAQVRRALAWNDAGWPWAAYGPVVMTAVRAGVPVLGANLSREQMRAAMSEAALDQRLSPAALGEQRERIRQGHCNTLPEAQIAPMTRIQIARDVALAETALQQRQPGRTVLVLAGNGHVDRALGIPQHVPADVRLAVIAMQAGAGADASRADQVWTTPALPPRDYCAQLKPQR